MSIIQKELILSRKSRGFHLITEEVLDQLPEIESIKTGLAHIFIHHTSASLTINENADPTVRHDFETYFTRVVPEDTSLYKHVFEGPDDMTSHIKSSLLGSSVSIPITGGRFNLGTWQGIYLCEFRTSPKVRKVLLSFLN